MVRITTIFIVSQIFNFVNSKFTMIFLFECFENKRKGRAKRGPKPSDMISERGSRSDERSTAAAGEDQKGNDNNPDAVVVIEQVAEAVVIHNSSSVSESARGDFRSQYHNMSIRGNCA